MTDPTAWQTPPYGAPPVWTPPPKPGLVPLRPLTFGQLLGTPFQVLRRNPGALLGPAVLIQALVLLSTLATVGAATGFFAYRIARATDANRGAITAGGIAGVIAAGLVALALSIIGSAALQAIVVVDVANGVLGHRPRGRFLWAATRGRRWALVGYIALLASAIAVALLVVAGIAAAFIVPAISSTGSARTALITTGVILGVVGGAGFTVFAVWAWGRLSLAGVAIVLERQGVRGGIRRSWQLTRGSFWRVWGAQVLVYLACSVATQIISVPFSLVFELGVGLVFPTGSPTSGDIDTTGLWISGVSYAVLLLLTLIVGAITNVIEAAASALVYVDQRMRRDGLDLVLMRYVEDTQAGRPAGDPFAAPAHRTAPTAGVL